jgi:mannose-1-phosphate guanylyltransferase/mannose-1-phosphate guanylyltransferase/mannose-6-phosphate isomerase
MEIGHRPWGFYEVIQNFDNCKIKRITVFPHKKLSLQSHQHRAEHWTCLTGTGLAQINDNFVKLDPNVHVFINLRDKHRLINNADANLVIIEIQTGTYFGEDDITRYEDDYGRV